MAITSGFFNSVNGDRRYNAAQIGEYLQYIVGSGVFPYVSTSLQVLAADGMTVEVQAGRAMLDHHYMDNDAPITLTLNAGGSQDRIDGIIMYVDMTERACGITIKEGTPAAAPVRPAMTRTDVRKEYMLAAIRIPKLSTGLTQSNITDTRPDTTVCGWVSGLIDQVDTSTLFNQWQAAYEEAYAETQDYLAAQKAAWAAFFTAVAEDNLVPVPNVDAIGKAIVVNAAGDGYVLQAPDNTLTAQGAAADAAAVGRALTVPNLLDNSDFSNPVNTNGADSYSGDVYNIDKWRGNATTKSIELVPGGLKITPESGKHGYLRQFLEPKQLAGKTFTAAVRMGDGTLLVATGVYPAEEPSSEIVLTSAETAAVLLAVTAGANKSSFQIRMNSGAVGVAKWAALYEGEYEAETLPVYRPRGYAIEAVICGGGGGLNFKVVGGTTQPTNPTENTIWVNTSTTISSYVFAAAAPSNPTSGMVWISIGTASGAEFNALKKNGLQVYPISAKQYVNGAWVDKTAKSYQGGAWVDWWNGELYKNGNEYENITGGWKVGNIAPSGYSATKSATLTKNSTNMVFSGAENTAWAQKTIDLTNVTTLTVKGTTTAYVEVQISKTKATGYAKAAFAKTSAAGTVNMVLDVSEFSGEYYVIVAVFDASTSFTITEISVK